MNRQRKETREKRQGNVARSAMLYFSLFSFIFSLPLTSCGFHLRGQESASLPPALATLRLSAADYAPLTVEMRNALKGQAGVKIVEDVNIPAATLSLYNEIIQSQVLAIDITGKVSDYLLNYSVTFALTAADGKPMLAPQTIKLQREYTFDKLNVLAKEKEDEFLRLEMQRDAVQQILRLLARIP